VFPDDFPLIFTMRKEFSVAADLEGVQHRQPRIVSLGLAAAIAFIEICPATWAQSPAILTAKWTRRKREQDLLANQWCEIDFVTLIDREF